LEGESENGYVDMMRINYNDGDMLRGSSGPVWNVDGEVVAGIPASKALTRGWGDMEIPQAMSENLKKIPPASGAKAEPSRYLY
jgi:hypothetical protein